MIKKLITLMSLLPHIVYTSEVTPEVFQGIEKGPYKQYAQFGSSPGCKATIACYKCCTGEIKEEAQIKKLCKEEYKNWRNAQHNKPCGCLSE